MLPQRAARRLASRASPVSKRGLADVASGSFQYQVGEAAGTKFASRDLQGPMTTLAVVAQAGTRFQPQPGFTEGLEKFAFKVHHLKIWAIEAVIGEHHR